MPFKQSFNSTNLVPYGAQQSTFQDVYISKDIYTLHARAFIYCKVTA